ncbi:hypothetical protein J8273_1706 [Carpediemonas membranifera]|uniref:Uncharacterized protein n=1 Tax=Carpediemonas membranifera TaxID=201153 RepID=A0A8J6AXN8_9EUKA|nr:hypothetical protein J8273_1706 [Carpediemonas membranifera]|eukprot:KAG9396688.1 hypothetical protein J8273_1706 [Carpediemonas membranifera]
MRGKHQAPYISIPSAHTDLSPLFLSSRKHQSRVRMLRNAIGSSVFGVCTLATIGACILALAALVATIAAVVLVVYTFASDAAHPKYAITSYRLDPASVRVNFEPRFAIKCIIYAELETESVLPLYLKNIGYDVYVLNKQVGVAATQDGVLYEMMPGHRNQSVPVHVDILPTEHSALLLLHWKLYGRLQINLLNGRTRVGVRIPVIKQEFWQSHALDNESFVVTKDFLDT